MLIVRKSGLSGKTSSQEIPVTEEQLRAWELGELIQNVMPNLTPDQREFIMTGITADEWDVLFQAEDDE
jgi:hypothetical protein